MKIEPLAGHHCHHCSSHPIYRVSDVGPVEYRGLIFDVTKVYRKCVVCGTCWENTKDPDWREEAQRRYQERMGHDRA